MMEPIIITHIFDSPLNKVWDALTKEEALKKWYFNVENYVFEENNSFTFYEDCNAKKYLHRCTFLQIIPHKLIETTWSHPSHSKGESKLKWELSEIGTKTEVVLTHTGVENFADAGPDFSVENFRMGWESIVKNNLRNYLNGIEKLSFEIKINCPKNVVWDKLWNKENYKRWTNAFCEGSYYEGDLAQGNRVHLLTPSGEGMYSNILFLKEEKMLIFQHIGEIKNKLELPLDDSSKKWTGCNEAYYLEGEEDETTVRVELDCVPEYIGFMSKTFPLALQELKKISES